MRGDKQGDCMTIPATADMRHELSKADVANAIAAYLLTAPQDASARDAIMALIVALGVNPSYVADLMRQVRELR
jgi:hypothetical protein